MPEHDGQRTGAALIGTGTVIFTGRTPTSRHDGHAGQLQGDSTSLQRTITDNAIVAFNQTTTGTFNGTIGGSGSC